MAKSILTEYEEYCSFCGRPCFSEHHLLFGRGIRNLADQDGLTLPICEQCHTSGRLADRIHDNPMAEKLSKMLGQLAFEKKKVAEGATEDYARIAFRRRYGCSYL